MGILCIYFKFRTRFLLAHHRHWATVPVVILSIFTKIDFTSSAYAQFDSAMLSCRQAKSSLDAIQECNNIIADAVENKNNELLVSALFYRGNNFYRIRNYTAALNDYNQALTVAPNNVSILRARGLTKNAMGNCKDAWGDLAGAMLKITDDFVLLLAISYCALQLGQNEEAIRYSLSAILMNRRDPRPRLNLANAYSKTGEYAKSLVAYDDVLSPPVRADLQVLSEAHLGKGITYARMQRFESAVEQYSKAIQLNPRNKEAYQGRSHAYTQIGQLDLAKADANSFLHLDKPQQ